MDKGPEFTSSNYKLSCKGKEIIRVYSKSDKHMQNGYIERFNRTSREDILDAYLISSLKQYQILSDMLSLDYNDNPPHINLGP